MASSFRDLNSSAGISGEGNGTPLQYSCLANPMDGEAWQAAVHGVPKSQTRLSDFTFTFHFHELPTLGGLELSSAFPTCCLLLVITFAGGSRAF